MVALVLGTAVTADAKVKKRGTRKQQPRTTVQQGKYTQEGVSRLSNGDVSDIQMAFIQDLYMQYVYTGNLENEDYFRYVKLKFTDEALQSLTDEDGVVDWSCITGKTGGASGFDMTAIKFNDLGDHVIQVTDGVRACYFKVVGTDGAFKIGRVSATPFE